MAEPQIKDQRGWAPVDTGYLDNPKMLDVLDASGTATLMHLASILYCAQHFTDGHISPGVARRKVGATKDDDRLLIDAGLWHETGHDCPVCPDPEPGKVYVHNFLEHNRTAAQAKRVSARRSEAAKARWAKAKAPDASSMQSALQDAVQPAMQNGDVCNAERERERKRDSSAPKRASKLPDSWTPTAEHQAQAAQAGINITLEAEKMRDWALSKGETRKDWNATFRNWLRNARPTPGYTPKPVTGQRVLEEWELRG